MEENIFPKPAVAGLLETRYVEARLHDDGVTNIDRILQLKKDLTGTLARPVYLVLDPATERTLAKREGGTFSDREFAAFLAGPVERGR
ncbi:MAG: hypothetical protein AB1726_03455 [Planctomycetota bacterium]